MQASGNFFKIKKIYESTGWFVSTTPEVIESQASQWYELAGRLTFKNHEQIKAGVLTSIQKDIDRANDLASKAHTLNFEQLDELHDIIKYDIINQAKKFKLLDEQLKQVITRTTILPLFESAAKFGFQDDKFIIYKISKFMRIFENDELKYTEEVKRFAKLFAQEYEKFWKKLARPSSKPRSSYIILIWQWQVTSYR